MFGGTIKKMDNKQLELLPLGEQKNQDLKSHNIEAIKKASLKNDPSKGDDSVLCFREEGKRKVNYWPSTNHWQAIDDEQQVDMYGPVEKFIEWYKGLEVREKPSV